MKHRILLPLLALTCTLALCGCGDTGASISSASEGPQSFGQVPDSPVETAPVTASSEETAPAPSLSPDDTPVSAQEDMTELAIQAVILCQAVDQLPYSPDDPLYFWRAVGYLSGLAGGGSAVISEEDVAVYAGALFPLSLADSSAWPALTEEDPLVTWDGNHYSVHLPEIGKLELSLEEPLEGSSQSVRAELYQDGTSLGAFSVSLQAYSGPDSGREKFDHSILGLESLS